MRDYKKVYVCNECELESLESLHKCFVCEKEGWKTDKEKIDLCEIHSKFQFVNVSIGGKNYLKKGIYLCKDHLNSHADILSYITHKLNKKERKLREFYKNLNKMFKFLGELGWRLGE